MGAVVLLEDKRYVEIIPSGKEEGKRIEQELRKIDPRTIVSHFTERFGEEEIEVFRVKQFILKRDGAVSLGKEALIVIQRNEENEERMRVSVKSVNRSYRLIPHSEVVKKIESLVRNAGYTPKTYIQIAGVSFRSLTVTDKPVKAGAEEYLVSFVANNSYNYSSALRVHLYLFNRDKKCVYPLLADVLYRKHRDDVTAEEFESSLKFAEKVVEELPRLKSIKVDARDVLSSLSVEEIEVRYWKRKGERKVVVIPVGKTVMDKVISETGRITDVLTLWKTLSEVVFTQRISGLNLRIKRRFEKVIFRLLENYMRSLKVLEV